MKPKEYSLVTMARIDYPLSPERIMSELVPWFTTWGFDLDTSKSISDTISLFMESRESPRWGLLGNGVVASERHAWSAWTILRRLELHGKCVAKSPDTEFLRIVAGTRQIKEGIRRSGLSQDDKIGWVFYLPEHRGETPLGSERIPRSCYNTHSNNAMRIISSLNGRLVVKRPVPTEFGLSRIGGDVLDGESDSLETSFIHHLTNSIIN